MHNCRKLGLCTLIFSAGGDPDGLHKRHAETGFRILSEEESFRGIAGYVLHYMEHWDGSGWPSGLCGQDIPLASRIIALTAAVSSGLSGEEINRLAGTVYDPDLAAMLKEIKTDKLI